MTTELREVNGKPVFEPPEGATPLPDNTAWTHRHEYFSLSGKVYILAVEKNTGQWSCSCPSWIFRHTCKHLDSLRPIQESARCSICGTVFSSLKMLLGQTFICGMCNNERPAILRSCDGCGRGTGRVRPGGSWLCERCYRVEVQAGMRPDKSRPRAPRKPKPELVPLTLSLPRKIRLED